MDRVKVLAAIASGVDRTMVFVRTKRGADRLVSQLKREGVVAGAIHGDLRQSAREQALQRLPGADTTSVLVATDVAARGIHVDDVDVVVHFDPPEEHKGYVHRSGRTARAGREGIVVDVRAVGPGARGRAAPDAGSASASADHRGLLERPAPGRPRHARRSGSEPQGRHRFVTAGSLTRRAVREPVALVRSGHERAGLVRSPWRANSSPPAEWIEVRVAVRRRAARPGARVRIRTEVDARGRAPPRRRSQQDRSPPWKRAEILDTAAASSSPQRTEEFARIIAGEAAKPIKTARVEAQRAVSTFTFAAVAARTLAGDVVPMDASAAGEGKLAFTLRLPIGVVGAISPFNFPLNLVAHKLAPAIAAGCPVVLKPASQTPLSAITLARRSCSTSAVSLPVMLNVVTGGGGTVGNAIVDHPDIAMITFTGSPEVGWGIKAAGAAQEGRPRARQQRAADHRAERRRRGGGEEGVGRRLQPRRPVVHLDAAHLRARGRQGRIPRRARPARRRARRRRSDGRAHRRVGADLERSERDRVQSVGRRSRRRRAPRCSPAARSAKTACSSPTVLGNVTPDMKVCAQRGVRAGRRRRDLPRPRRGAAPRQRHALRAPGRDLHRRPRRCAARRLARSTSAACS